MQQRCLPGQDQTKAGVVTGIPFKQHVRRDGQAKVGYDTKAEADVEALRTKKRPYLCRLCGKWHIGRKAS